jgi:hypothetical protein
VGWRADDASNDSHGSLAPDVAPDWSVTISKIIVASAVAFINAFLEPSSVVTRALAMRIAHGQIGLQDALQVCMGI